MFLIKRANRCGSLFSSSRAEVAATVKRFEGSVDSTEASPRDREEIEGLIGTDKGRIESLATEEQPRQADQMDAEEQLCIEPAKLNEPEERVDRLEKDLE